MSILTEILREMYVDPEILEQLAMEQRDVLFRKMREEQVRRWRVKDAELQEKERRRPPKRTRPKVSLIVEHHKASVPLYSSHKMEFYCDESIIVSTLKQIQFLQGADGNPWVWVMGEHKNDLSYEELVSYIL